MLFGVSDGHIFFGFSNYFPHVFVFVFVCQEEVEEVEPKTYNKDFSRLCFFTSLTLDQTYLLEQPVSGN